MILSIHLNKKKKKTITMVFTHDPISDVKTNKNLKPLLSIFPSFKFFKNKFITPKRKSLQEQRRSTPSSPAPHHPCRHMPPQAAKFTAVAVVLYMI